MEKIYLFDVDGTLTPARQRMTDDFYVFFKGWIEDKKVYFVSGSDYEKIEQQIPKDILETIDGVFGCMGNTLHQKGSKVYENTFEPPLALLNHLKRELAQTAYRPMYGNHIEQRVGMINFSTVGRNAPKVERKDYHRWDTAQQERKEIASRINKVFENIEATVGGEISIDIYPVGWDKSQILEKIPPADYFFFGDRALPGGNDYALAKALDVDKDIAYNVNSFEETWQILKKLDSEK